jgi:purine-binding chemotaxis protein CheW
MENNTESKSKSSTTERQVVVFNLGEEEFGVNISEVREIIRMEQITKIPNSSPYILGVINLRGGIIVVIDLAMKLGLPSKQADKNTRIIVVEVGDNTVGMVVDSATEVLRLSGDQIEDAPEIITEKIDADYIEGVGILGERLLILLDLSKVLHAKEVQNLQSMGSKIPVQQEAKPTEEKKETVLEPPVPPSSEEKPAEQPSVPEEPKPAEEKPPQPPADPENQPAEGEQKQ